MSHVIIVVNAGSSSVKFSVHGARDEAPLILRGQIEGLRTAPRIKARDTAGTVLIDEAVAEPGARLTHAEAFERIATWMTAQLDDLTPIAVGHRVVHGGPTLRAPARITDDVLAHLEELVPFAPLHQPHNLAAIRAVAAARPDLPQVACFDTAFHRSQPSVAEHFAIPREYFEQGIRRYGFHGLSYEYIARTLLTVAPDIARGRVVIAHLGSGASMCGIRNGRSVDSTMGLTALDGLPMGTRCGNLDPGVIFHLLRAGMTADALEDMLYTRSGLLGISGVSNDMRDLLASSDPLADEAIAYFAYRIAGATGSLAAAIGGLDGFVFTAGIGEKSPDVRARVCSQLEWLGIALDPDANASNAQQISRSGSTPVWVLPTNEERMIALHTLGILAEQRNRN